MKSIFLHLLLITSFLSYSKTKKDSTDINIIFYGINLSEDMSKISTHNDEILMLIYPMDIKDSIVEPVSCTYFVIDKENKSKTIKWKTSNTTSNYLIIILEIDSEEPIKRIEPIFRVNFQNIYSALIKQDNKSLRSYLGDNDIITISKLTIPSKKKRELSLTGTNNMDSYHNFLTFENL